MRKAKITNEKSTNKNQKDLHGAWFFPKVQRLRSVLSQVQGRHIGIDSEAEGRGLIDLSRGGLHRRYGVEQANLIRHAEDRDELSKGM